MRIKRDVALKILPGAFAADPDRTRRFEQEAMAAGMLNHPNALPHDDQQRAVIRRIGVDHRRRLASGVQKNVIDPLPPERMPEM